MIRQPGSRIATFILTVWVIGLSNNLSAASDTLLMKAKLRDFPEIGPKTAAAGYTAHRDFNNDDFLNCHGPGAVSMTIDTLGQSDPSFPMDHRNPKLVNKNIGSGGKACFIGEDEFDDWYNDRDNQTNRPFLMEIPFVKNPSTGLYEYHNTSFFPLNDNSEFTLLGPDGTFGHLQNGTDSLHNYGFTMEFHTTFTYDRSQNQIFQFTGDDDVWVYINGKLVIDLGGVHSALSRSVALNDLNLIDGESYPLDFFFAERHTRHSNILITTSLQLTQATPRVAKPVADPGAKTFISSQAVALSSTTPGAVIHYTLNGSVPTTASPIYSSPLSMTTTTTLKALAVRVGWDPSEILTETYTKESIASQLTLLDGDGKPIAGYLTETEDSITIKLTTTQAGLGQIQVQGSSRTAGDAETILLTAPQTQGDALVYTVKVPLGTAGTGTAGNGRLEHADFDTLTVRWTNPANSSDAPSSQVVFRPASRQASAHFAANAGGDEIAQYAGGETMVHVVVKDQKAASGMNYTALLTTQTPQGKGADTLVVTLSELTSGTFVASIPVAHLHPGKPNDAKLQLLPGDKIHLSFVDPIDGDKASAGVGYGVATELLSVLQFMNAEGSPLAPGTVWDLGNSKVHLTYVDDYAGGTIAAKTVSIRVRSVTGTGAIFEDRETLTLGSLVQLLPTKGQWSGSLPLADASSPIAGNGILEVYVQGEIRASVLGHLNTGTAADSVHAILSVARPNEQAIVEIVPVASTTPGATEGSQNVIITVKDQDLSVSTTDSLGVTIRCSNSGDRLQFVRLIEVSPGVYVSQPIEVHEGDVSLNDNTLSCLSGDVIVVSYVDPVYDEITEISLREVARPQANPVSSSFLTQISVTLSTPTPGAQIYYTLDGSLPGASSRLYSSPIAITATTTLKAVALRSGWKNSRILTESYTKEKVASRLEIMDAYGNPIGAGFLTDADNAFSIKLTTTQADLLHAEPTVLALQSRDLETVKLINATHTSDGLVFIGSLPMLPGAQITGNNGRQEPSVLDTLIVTWTNPMNPSDKVSDTVVVRPAPRQSSVYISASPTGSELTQTTGSEDSLYVVVKDQAALPGVTYRARAINQQSGDSLWIPLTQSQPGTLVGLLPLDNSGQDKPGRLPVSIGDQILIIYIDPVDGDQAETALGYGVMTEHLSQIRFTDKDGVELAEGVFRDPDEGFLYLSFVDDWADGNIASITVKLHAESRNATGVVHSDSELLTLTQREQLGGTKARWSGKIPLQQALQAVSADGSIQVAFLGVVSAKAQGHNNQGGAKDSVSASIKVAYPNEAGTIRITPADSDGPVTRGTGGLVIHLQDQNFSSGKDSVSVTISCSESGDQVQVVTLVEVSPGVFQSSVLLKDESEVDLLDDKLSCRPNDNIQVRYVDPVYGTETVTTTSFRDIQDLRLYFASEKDEKAIQQAGELQGEAFLVIVEGTSPRRDRIDSVIVGFTTPEGEVETFWAVETAMYSGRFTARVPFGFSPAGIKANDGLLQGAIQSGSSSNQVTATATVTLGDLSRQAQLLLVSGYVAVVKAVMEDTDSDGAGDRLSIRFAKKLPYLPSSLDTVFWNAALPSMRQSADASRIAFGLVDGKVDSSLVLVDFLDSQFAKGLTAAVRANDAPYLVLPADAVFGGARPIIGDAMGPIILKAVKLPSDLQVVHRNGQKVHSPDTIEITLSEPMVSDSGLGAATWSTLLRFSNRCDDAKTIPIPIHTSEPPVISADSLVWRIIVDSVSNSPLVGTCISLNDRGAYHDRADNQPLAMGVSLQGKDRKRVVQFLGAYPPVAGMDPNDPRFAMANSEARGRSEGDWAMLSENQSWYIPWIPPQGFSAEGSNVDNYVPTHPDEMSMGSEFRDVEPMPSDISTVQVVANRKYIAYIGIYDNLGNPIRTFVQAFGYRGELDNPSRLSPNGMVSFLVWDLRDRRGLRVGQGAYVWKIRFDFPDGHKSEMRVVRTGVISR